MKRIRRAVLLIIAIAISLVFIVPFYAIFSMSSYSTVDLYKGLRLIPGNYLLRNLTTVMEGNFVRSYANSILVSCCATFLSVMISAMMGYALTKLRFRMRSFLNAFVVVTMMIPTQLNIVAFAIQMRYMHLNNSLIPLVAVFGANSYGVFWMAQYMRRGVPQEVLDSARIDGCHELKVFLRIVLPYVQPALFTLSLLVFIWSWNNYLMPVIIINRVSLFTIPLAVSTLGNVYFADLAARITGLAVGTFPLFIVFIVGSRSFIRGLTAGAIKG